MTASEQSPAMPERWTELITSRRQKRLCAEQVEALKASCDKECGKKHFSECPGCYGKVVERMRTRYVGSPEREWFSKRRAFVQELEGLFADVKQRKRSLSFVEARIESEKEAWYRWMLRQHPDFLAVADGGAHQSELRSMLDDPDKSREELVKMMWEGVGEHGDWASRVGGFAEKVEAAGGDEEQLRKLYEDEFFINGSTGEPLEHAEKYLGQYKSDAKPSLENVIGAIVQDSQQSRSSQGHRDNHQSRLDDLRRAKTAFELKAQTKGRLPGGQVPAAGDELSDLPPCSVCQKAVDPKDVLSCGICQAVAQMGGGKKLTVYCSEDCYRHGHDEHAEREHGCEAADKCVHLNNEDVDMDGGKLKAVVCKDCLDQMEITPYCSEACAVENLAGHRLAKHEVKTAVEEVQSLFSPLEEVVESTLQTKNPGLKMSGVD